MDVFQDQGLVKIAVIVLALAATWWAFRLVLTWAKRLSRLGCMAICALALIAVVASRLG